MDILRSSKNEVYQRDIAVIKKYSENYVTVTLHKALRRSGFERIDSGDDSDKGKKNTAGNTEKSLDSICRARRRVRELALANRWTHFITMTIDPKKFDREDLDTYKIIANWIQNYNRLKNLEIRFLLIPELHADQQHFHFHGLLQGLPAEHLTPFKLTDKLPISILIKLKQNKTVYNWEPYSKRFGYITLENIICETRIANYICKYITQGFTGTKISMNRHLFYASKGLKSAEVLYKGQLRRDIEFDYENDWVKIKRFDNVEEALMYFKD